MSPRRAAAVDELGQAATVTGDDLHLLDRTDRAERLDVARGLWAAAVDTPAGARRAGQAALTASADTAAVRSEVSAIPSTSASGDSVSGSKST